MCITPALPRFQSREMTEEERMGAATVGGAIAPSIGRTITTTDTFSIATPIRVPEDLHVPKEIKELFDGLTPDGARMFADEVIEALSQASNARDLTPVSLVIESWYRTLSFVTAPGFNEAWDEDLSAAPAMTAAEVREYLGVGKQTDEVHDRGSEGESRGQRPA